MHKLTCLFGGTFDPVHYGHLMPLAELQQRIDCHEIHVIPAAIPPHRLPPVASTDQRLAMLRIALRDYPGWKLDTCELERSGPSYSVVTLQSMRASRPDDSLCLVMGSDAFAGFPSWYHWQEIFELCHIVVIERPGESAADEHEWAQKKIVSDADMLRSARAGYVYPVSLPLLELSATDIRDRLATGQDVQGMLPEGVLEYIQKHEIY